MNLLNQIFGGTPDYSKVLSPYQQVQGVVPGLPTMTGTAASNIQNDLSGLLSPDVQQQIKNAGAAWGINSGMPGSGAAGNVTLQSLGLTSLGEQQTGLTDYTNFLTGVGGQMMPVSTEMNMAEAGAAPSPIFTGILSLLGTALGGYLGAQNQSTQSSSSTPSSSTPSSSTPPTSTDTSALPNSFDPGSFSGFDTSSFSDLYGVGGGSGLGDLGVGAGDLGDLGDLGDMGDLFDFGGGD
jgi:hypothetical protein